MKRHHDLVDLELLLRFIPNSGKSIAVARDPDDLKKDPIFLPLSQIEWFHKTGHFDAGLKVIKVTMPQSLAEDKELV